MIVHMNVQKVRVLSCGQSFRLLDCHKMVFVLSFSTRKKESYAISFNLICSRISIFIAYHLMLFSHLIMNLMPLTLKTHFKKKNLTIKLSTCRSPPPQIMFYDNLGSNEIYASTFHWYIWNIFHKYVWENSYNNKLDH